MMIYNSCVQVNNYLVYPGGTVIEITTLAIVR